MFRKLIDILFLICIFVFLYYTCWLPSVVPVLPPPKVELKDVKEITPEQFEAKHVRISHLC